jgi:hypothetical protein
VRLPGLGEPPSILRYGADLSAGDRIGRRDPTRPARS